jgi:hypothetical protein
LVEVPAVPLPPYPSEGGVLFESGIEVRKPGVAHFVALVDSVPVEVSVPATSHCPRVGVLLPM